MSAKGTAAKSASGAAMSQYDVEVEARLQALEAQSHEKCAGGSDNTRIANLEAKVEDLIQRLQSKMEF